MMHSVVVLFFMVLVGIYNIHGQDFPCCNNLGLCFGNQNDVLPLSKCSPLLKNHTECWPPLSPGPDCCVDCNRLQHNCTVKHPTSVARGTTENYFPFLPPPWPPIVLEPCCPSELVIWNPFPDFPGILCNCCMRCKPKRRCRDHGRRKSRCITEEDPIYNYNWCEIQGGTIKHRLCEPEGCACCLNYKP